MGKRAKYWQARSSERSPRTGAKVGSAAEAATYARAKAGARTRGRCQDQGEAGCSRIWERMGGRELVDGREEVGRLVLAGKTFGAKAEARGQN